MKRKLAVLLPVLQVGLSLALGLWGSAQAKEVLRNAAVYDYLPGPDFVSCLLNLPATLVTAAIFRKWAFQIGPAFSWVTFAVYLFFVAVLWYLIGLKLGQQVNPSGSNPKFGFSPWGVSVSVMMMVMGVLLIHSALGYFVSLAALLWSLAVLFLSRRQSAQTTTPSMAPFRKNGVSYVSDLGTIAPDRRIWRDSTKFSRNDAVVESS